MIIFDAIISIIRYFLGYIDIDEMMENSNKLIINGKFDFIKTKRYEIVYIPHDHKSNDTDQAGISIITKKKLKEITGSSLTNYTMPKLYITNLNIDFYVIVRYYHLDDNEHYHREFANYHSCVVNIRKDRSTTSRIELLKTKMCENSILNVK